MDGAVLSGSRLTIQPWRECALEHLVPGPRSRHGEWNRGKGMSWPELERLVTDAEASESLRRSLRRCRSREELLLAARRLGYRVTRINLQNAYAHGPLHIN